MIKSKLFWHFVLGAICVATAVLLVVIGMPTPLPGVVAGAMFGLGSIIIFAHDRKAPDLVMHESCWNDNGKDD